MADGVRGRVERELFGTSLRGFRFFVALAEGFVVLFAGLAAHELGGSAGSGDSGLLVVRGLIHVLLIFRLLMVGTSGVLVICLLKSEDPRWWIAIGARSAGRFRGYGDPPPQRVVVGMHRDFLDQTFNSCELVGHLTLTNRYGIENDSIHGYDEVFVCRNLRQLWPDFWKHFRYCGRERVRASLRL